MKQPRPSRVCISEKPSRTEGCHLTGSNARPSIVVVVGLTGVPRPNCGAGLRGSGPKGMLNFLPHTLKNAESNAELKGLDVDSLVLEPVQVN